MEPPAGFRYIDAHTHLHPPRLFAAIRRWFDEHTDWSLRGPSEPDEVVAALRAAAVDRFAFFSYAHRPGMSRYLNRWIRDTATRYPDGIPLGTVHAGDEDPGAVVDEACGTWGLAGLKVHVQVQRFYPDDPGMLPVYERLVALDRVLIIHVGTAPHTNEFTGLARFERVLERFPRLRASICHMGAFETRMALQLLDSLATDWDPKQYKDTYVDELRDRIDAKEAGEDVVAEEPEERRADVIDLSEALQRSLDEASSGKRRRTTRRRSRKSA